MLNCYSQNLFTILKYVFKKEQMTYIQHYKHTGIDKNVHKPQKLDHCQGLLPATRITMHFWVITFLSSFLGKTPHLFHKSNIAQWIMSPYRQTEPKRERCIHTKTEKEIWELFSFFLDMLRAKKKQEQKQTNTFLSCNILHCLCSNTTISITVIAGAGRVHHWQQQCQQYLGQHHFP